VTVDARITAADGEEMHVEMAAVRLSDEPDAVGEVLVQIVDVTERHRREVALRAEADHDPLTALQNRRSFERALVTHLGVSARYGTAGALLLADVDRFKQVNDTHGHVVGDEVLREVARILRSRLRGSDVVGRLGGDEFAVLLPLATRSGAEAVAASIVAAVRARGAADPTPGWPVTMSVGASMITGDQPTAADAFRKADRALYAAKQGGRDCWVLCYDG
jgi:diguanylate cyclase (GGDEF)-like protein